MKKIILRVAFLWAVLMGAPAVFVSPALALELDAARADGQVIELHNGYLAPGDGASSAAQALVAEVNAKRRAYYEDVAAQQGVSLSDVELIFGEQIFEKAQPGIYQRIDGSRVRQ